MAGESLELSVRVDGRLEAQLEVPPGISVLFGPSGSGKSTCLSLIAGLLRPDSGAIRLGDETLTDVERGVFVPAHARRVALVFQSLALFPHLTVLRNVEYGVPPGAAGRARAWMQRMRIDELADRLPATLSGGEAQRVALARALASEPRVLLLDEPFSALDFALRRQLAHELRELIGELALPAILVTHDAQDALELGTRMIALASGKVLAAGPPEEVLGTIDSLRA
jgi:molybdate transport system ATP-binding protein